VGLPSPILSLLNCSRYPTSWPYNPKYPVKIPAASKYWWTRECHIKKARYFCGDCVCAITIYSICQIFRLNRPKSVAGDWQQCLPFCSGARWPSSRPLSRYVGVLKVGCQWKIALSACRQTPTYYNTPATTGKQATVGMLATARIPAS
jgi:hypothetical protein